jgi:hypothetical protein
VSVSLFLCLFPQFVFPLSVSIFSPIISFITLNKFFVKRCKSHVLKYILKNELFLLVFKIVNPQVP